MSQWQIDPDGVSAIVETVAEHAEALDAGTSVDVLSGVLGGLTWGGGITACVAESVYEAMDSQMRNINAVKARVVAGVRGAVGATTAYVNADEQMAAAMQAQAARSADTGDMSWFDQNG